MTDTFDLSDLLAAFGDQRFAPPIPVVPDFGDVVPWPRTYDRTGVAELDAAWISVLVPAAARPAEEVLLTGCFRAGISAAPVSGGYPIELVLDDGAPDGEAYELDARSDGMTIRSSSSIGLVRGAATARQLVRRAVGGIEVATGHIDDAPVVPVRMLGGWGLYRDESIETALEIALEGKYNRVLYNWWAATPDERMGAREEHLVTRARDLGVELVVELRRQALGSAFDPSDAHALEPVLRHYDDAVDRGFRSFGFLFDDTDLDSFAAELGLVTHLYEHIGARLGDAPEFFYCPRYYWLPGTMDYSWLPVIAELMGSDSPGIAALMGAGGEPRSARAATDLQTRFLRELGDAVPDDAHVYLAHWLHGTPDEWETDLEQRWTSYTGRTPFFWDNQMMNDYRAGLVYPFAVHQRPAGFARVLDGYVLNSSPPIAAFAPGSITGGAWAWNPDDYDPARAFGAAIGRCYTGAANEAVDALAAWCDLVGELMGERTMMEDHYGALTNDRVEELREGLTAIDALLAKARHALSHRAAPFASQGLAQLRDETDRIRLDIDLVEAASDPGATALVAADHALARLRTGFMSRLPAIPEVRDLVATMPDPSTFDTDTVAGVSWYLHYVLWAGAQATALAQQATSAEHRTT